MMKNIAALVAGLAALDLAYSTPISSSPAPSSILARTDVLCPHVPIWVAAGSIANGAGLGPNVFPGIDCGFNSFSGLCDCATISARSLSPPPTFTTKRQTGTACEDQSIASATAVHFADLNGDGRAEYLYVGANGQVTAFLNLGGPANNPAIVNWSPQGLVGPSGLPAALTRDKVIFADIDGDGKADFLYVHTVSFRLFFSFLPLYL